MKQKSLPFERFFVRCLVLLFLFLYLSGLKLKAQSFPELVFHNSTLETGVAGQDGAKYRFPNVATGMDAVVEILGRSSNQVVLSNIDSTGIGWDKAIQPIVGIPGTVPANLNWWMEFRINFYDHGTTIAKKVNNFVATGLDIDGDGQSIQEWVEMKKVKNYNVSTLCALTTTLLGSIVDLLNLNNNGQDIRIIGPVANYANVDTSATGVMATYEYDRKDQIDFMLGGTTGSGSSTAGMRMNSIWFKQFDLSPQPSILPVKLIDFTAKYDKNKVILNWSTAEEKQFSHFVIERSTDGKNFSDAALLFTEGTSENKKDYSYTDANLANKGGLLYYRLRMVDIDKNTSYSAVRIIRLADEKATLTLTSYPNPVVSDLRVTIPANWQGKKIYFELVNGNGQTVKIQKNAIASQTETITVSSLGRGIYFVKAYCGSETAQQRILKN